MPVKITEIIPTQGFEIVSLKIAEILLTEVSNQITLQGLPEDLGVFLERMTPFDKSEDLVINVLCDNLSYTGMTQHDRQSDSSFYIDITTRGYSQNTESIDTNVSNKLKKYAGFCSYILSSTKYKYLDTDYGLVGGVYVKSIYFEDLSGNQDAAYSRTARITLDVRILEQQNMETPRDFGGNDSETKLSNTDLGQKLIFNN